MNRNTLFIGIIHKKRKKQLTKQTIRTHKNNEKEQTAERAREEQIRNVAA